MKSILATAAGLLTSCTLVVASPAPVDEFAEILKRTTYYKEASTCCGTPVFDFAKTFTVIATPDQVVNNVSVPAPGQPGAVGIYRFGIQPETETICYNITHLGVTAEYSSPALTATHIHEAVAGKSGPPRIAFPNPVGDNTRRVSVGCLTGPFKTGIIANGKDTGEGFSLQKIIDNPVGFNADAHTKAFLPGVFRGGEKDRNQAALTTMNDPGLDNPIGENADDIEKPQRYEGEDEDEAEDDYLSPSRWWITSTAVPLIAGTFGPMASAFNICALVQSWRVEIPPGGVEEHGKSIQDPKWLLAANAVSLVFALVANMSLLLQLAKRLSFVVAQPITIIGWYISSIILICLVAVASTHLRLPSPPGHALTQAFYYAIMSAALYFIIATLMLSTVYGAWRGHYKKEFNLTTSQRTLMLQTISLLVYMHLGAVVYAHIEGWEFLDAVYWADVTLLTVGTGDYSPMTHLGRGLLFPFSIGGIVFVGLVIGSIRALVLERGKKKMSARMVEKTREKALKRLNPAKGTVKISLFKKTDLSAKHESERERREEEFRVMRIIQDDAASRRKWTSLGASATAWFVLWLIGAVVFWKAERNQKWSYFDALYYAYVSLLTIGYGDFQPMSNSAKPFFVFWSLLAVPTMTILISHMGDTIVKAVKDVTLWIGETTVLPNESGFRATVRKNIAKMTKGNLGRAAAENKHLVNQPAGTSGEECLREDEAKTDRERKAVTSAGIDRAAQGLEVAEEEKAQDAQARGDVLSADKHHYHYLLIKELRSVMQHVHESPPRRYSFEEWAWFLRLLGEDETSGRTHHSPLANDNSTVPPTDGRPQGAAATSDGIDRSGGDKSAIAAAAAAAGEEDDERAWSWLGKRSPLQGGKDEAEWVLEKLSLTLERELQRERDQAGSKPSSSSSSSDGGTSGRRRRRS
ncbi:MAG: hypothetical protein M1825_003732 [Sarcosagium campestre]|nr:MAG: hypothetical protein M1825_003732 [Sarcosagium campestre]